MSNRAKEVAIILSLGIIMANLVMSSSSVFDDFSSFPVTTSWLYAAAVICGVVIGTALGESSASLYGMVLVAWIAVSIFSAVIVGVAVLGKLAFLDLVVLFAFQQSFARFIVLCVLGYAGVFGSFVLRLIWESFDI